MAKKKSSNLISVHPLIGVYNPDHPTCVFTMIPLHVQPVELDFTLPVRSRDGRLGWILSVNENPFVGVQYPVTGKIHSSYWFDDLLGSTWKRDGSFTLANNGQDLFNISLEHWVAGMEECKRRMKTEKRFLKANGNLNRNSCDV